MARYLVTGGAGFIGSHLCDQLLADGHTVRVIDDLSTGKVDNLPPGVEFVRGCISNPALVQSCFDDIAGCFHLAAIASVQRSCEQWSRTHAINLSASVAILDEARQRGVPLVYASSAAVYGDNAAIPLSEDAALSPLSPYGADKAGIELHAQAAAASFGLGTTGLRFFNVYGPRQDPASPYSGVISIFAQRLAEGQELCIHGDGEQSRDFIYVADVVAYLCQAMQLTKPAQARVFNVCTGRRTRILDLAKQLAKQQGIEPDIRFAPARNGDIRHSCGDPQRAHEGLAYRADTRLPEGLSRLLDALA